jgi:hypothetical protein
MALLGKTEGSLTAGNIVAWFCDYEKKGQYRE